MHVRLSASLRRLRLFAVAFAIASGITACGQIGPLYLPDQTDPPTEQTEAEQESTDSDTLKKNDEKPDSL